MSVLSLFHPNPYDSNALKPGYSRPTPPPVVKTPIEREPKKETETETETDTKGGPPKPTDPNIKFLEYKVRASDDMDVWHLAAGYGVSVDAIRRYNRRVVFDYLDNVIGETIYIPLNVKEGDHIPKQPESDPKKVAEFKFVQDTGSSHAEAKFYLEEAEWDYEGALKSYHDDVAWEKSKESREKAAQLEKLKQQQGTPSEKLAAVLAPTSLPTSSTSSSTSLPTSPSSPSAYSTIPPAHSSITFPPPSYSFEGVQQSVSMQQMPPPWEPTTIKQLQQPLLQDSSQSTY